MGTLKKLSDMRGRRVLITGGTGHLGRVMADTLAEMGASLIILDRPGSAFATLEKHLSNTWKVECVSLPCDLEREEDRLQAIAALKNDGRGLSCLINNAAFVGSSELKGWNTNFANQSLETWRRALEVNLTAPFHLSQAFAPELAGAKGGSIINITSIYAEHAPDWSLYKSTSLANPAAYSASKAGLLQLTKWLAATLSPLIRVNAVSPGGIYRRQPESFVKKYIKKTALKRMATEDDFQGAIAYLASDMSSYVTGQVIKVDGGWEIA